MSSTNPPLFPTIQQPLTSGTITTTTSGSSTITYDYIYSRTLENMFNYCCVMFKDEYILIENKTLNTKEVVLFQEGFDRYCEYIGKGNEVVLTKLSKEAAKVLYGQV